MDAGGSGAWANWDRVSGKHVFGMFLDRGY